MLPCPNPCDGAPHKAEDESQEWPELHAMVREARKRYQAAEEMPDWNGLDGMLEEVRGQIKQASA
jgi:hypothetical protein